MGIYSWLFETSKKMRNNAHGKKIYDMLENAGIRIMISRFFNWIKAHYNERHPDSQMLESRMFFRKNKDRVRSIINILEDDVSRNVFKKMIYFRCYSVYKKLPHNSMRTQYFINDFFDYKSNEVFVDCGAYDGDSIIGFKKCMRKNGLKGRYQIIAFEPDTCNYQNLMRNHPDIIGIRAGVWKEDGFLSFEQSGSSSASLLNANRNIHSADRGDIITIPVQSIDNTVACKKATFIKMDIEGSEYEALIGAKNTICRNHPKLAICIYHSNEDMLRLIELIHEMVPEYHFYILQHSNAVCETVLYAVYKK